jgi:SOS response regulatory protein OraA/RecX
VQDQKYAQQITTEDNRTEKAIRARLDGKIENSDKVAKWMASRGYGGDEAQAISDALDSGRITKDQLQEKLERSGFPTSNLPTAGRLR